MVSFYLDTLVPVTIVRLGDPVTFTCALPKAPARRQIYWYKQRPGERLNMIAFTGDLLKPVYVADSSASRFQINEDNEFSNLTILETIEGDEQMYHCALIGYFNIQWSAFYLLFEGKNDFFCLFRTFLDYRKSTFCKKENISSPKCTTAFIHAQFSFPDTIF